MLEAIPVVEESLLNPRQIDNRTHQKFKVVTLKETGNSSVELKDIKHILLENYKRHLVNDNVQNSTRSALCNKLVLDCDKLSYLERSKDFPKLSYVYNGIATKSGYLHVSEKEVDNIVSLKYRINRENENRNDIKEALKMFWKMLKMQNLPGIPRIYAVCIKHIQNPDADIENETSKFPLTIR